MNVTEYSISDWDRMQREAEQRVRASRMKNSVRVGGEVAMPDFVKPREHSEATEVHRTAYTKKKGIFDLLNLNNFELDADRSMVLMLLALLSGDKNDELLTLALLYIML